MSSLPGKYVVHFILLSVVLISVTQQSGLAQGHSKIGIVRPALGETLTVVAPSAVALNLDGPGKMHAPVRASY